MIETSPAAPSGNESPSDSIGEGSMLSATWRVDRSLGGGGMATVYAATGLHGERAALKIMRPSLTAQPGALQRFLRESVIAKRIDHPGMVRSLGEGTTDEGSPYIALELLEGCTIDELWKSPEHRPSLVNLLRFFADVLDLLAVCHEKGIVHRDLKPGNIYVTEAGKPKVLDFGVARAEGLAEDFLRPGTAIGTPSFMAPEQAMGAWDHVDATADVFSIGATLFALLSGQRLHHGKTEAASFTLAATRPAPSLETVAPELPVDVVAFVDRALQWDKRARFRSAGEMRDTLLQITLALDPDDTPILPPRSAAGEEPTSSPTDSDSAREVAEAFNLLERAWRARRDQQSCESELASAAQRLHEAAQREFAGLTLAVLPWSLRLRSQIVWRPNAFVRLLEAMFADGIRAIEVLPECTEATVYRWLEVLLDESCRTRDEATDTVCLLWPLEPEGIHVGVASGLLGASAETAESAANGRRTVARLLDASGGVCERPPALSTMDTSKLLFDDVARRAAVDRRGPDERDALFVEQLVEALRELVPPASRDADAVALLRSVAADLLRDDHADLLLQAAAGLSETHDLEAVHALLPPESVHDLILVLDRTWQRTPDATERLRATLAAMGAGAVPGVLRALAQLESLAVIDVVTSYVEQHLPEHAEDIASILLSLSGETGYRMVRALADKAREASADSLLALSRHESSPLRIAAHACIHGTDHIGPAVADQLDAPGWRARCVALRVLTDFEVEDAAPLLLRMIESPGFHGRTRREQSVTLATLRAVDADLADSAAAALVRKHGLIRDDALNDTRVLAAEVLGEASSSEVVVEALRAAEAPMWWNPQSVRDAARAARERIEARIGAQEAT